MTSRPVLVACTLFALAAVSSLPHARGAQHETKQHGAATSDGQRAINGASPASPITESLSAMTGQPKTPTKYEGAKERIWSALSTPSFTDWILAVATIVYVIVTARTLRAIRRQADIADQATWATTFAARSAQDSAEEARRAGARIERLERPWLIVRIVKTNVKEMLYAARSDEPRAFPVVVNLEWELANHGRTPAWITNSSMPAIHFVLLPYGTTPPHRFEGDYDNTPVTGSTPLAATEKRSVSREEHDAIINGEAALVYSGSVYYRDIFASPDDVDARHETHFCFAVERNVLSNGLVVVGSFVIGGQIEWTKYT
jgi:hypothetical protein